MTTHREPPNHDTLTCYTNYRCRRPECVERYNAYNSPRVRAKRAGTWDGLVDATEVREHIRVLRQDYGVSLSSIAATCGIGKQSVVEFLKPQPGQGRGRRQRTSPETAAKILAVTPHNLVRRRVDATGSRRRLQALVAGGWPLNHIAARTNLKASSIGDFMQRSVLMQNTATEIAQAFDALKGQQPTRHGVERHQARRAREWASREKWPPPAYWADRMDVIDDPDFQPLYGVTRREIVAQDASWVMRTTGADKTTAAERLGVTRSYIEHAFREYPQYALDTAA